MMASKKEREQLETAMDMIKSIMRQHGAQDELLMEKLKITLRQICIARGED